MTQTINPADEVRVREILIKVLGSGAYIHIRRLGGMTNRTYEVKLEDGKHVTVRLPGEGTQKMISRRDEKINCNLACELGLDAKMYHLGESGEKVMAYIPGAETLTAQRSRQVDIVDKMVEKLRRLHQCGRDTGVLFQVFSMAADYEAVAVEQGVTLFSDYAQVKSRVMGVKELVDRTCGVHSVPCHNDPLPDNWVLGGDGNLYLLDWEYAGMNDAMWDLAAVSVESEFTRQEEGILLERYLQRTPCNEESMRFYANKIYLDYLWALWAKARERYGGEAMERYGLERYERMKKNLALYF